jgi:hypothetical protein
MKSFDISPNMGLSSANGFRPGWNGYRSLHEDLEAELEMLLREDKSGDADITDEQTDRIASLAFALQSLNKMVDLQYGNAQPAFKSCTSNET